VKDEDVNGNVVIRQTDLVLVEMPTLHLRRRVFAKRYPQPPSEHQGLVTLKFLTDHFDRWGAEKDAAGKWQFFVERT
jgi:hypothetical protein